MSQGLRDFMFTKAPDSKKEMRDIFVEKAYEMASEGDIAAMRLILSYTEGVPRPMIAWETATEERMTDEAIDQSIDDFLKRADAEGKKKSEEKTNKITEMILGKYPLDSVSEEVIREQIATIIG